MGEGQEGQDEGEEEEKPQDPLPSGNNRMNNLSICVNIHVLVYPMPSRSIPSRRVASPPLIPYISISISHMPYP